MKTDSTGNSGRESADLATAPSADTWVKVVLVVCDLMAIFLAACVAFGALSIASGMIGLGFVSFDRLLAERGTALVAAAAFACLYFLFAGHYHMRIPFWEETRAVAATGLFGLVFEGFLVFANKADVSRSSMFVSWIIAPFVIMWLRGMARRTLAARGIGQYRAVVFGRPYEIERATDLITADGHLALSVCGSSDTTDLTEAEAALAAAGASDAVIALSCADEAEIRLAADLRRRGYAICVIPPAMGMSASMNVQYILGRDAMLLVSRPEITPRLNRAAKRAFDIAVAGGLLVTLGVPMALVAVVVALDGGSPFFSHKRIGKDGKAFACLKFRSMRVDAEAKLEEYLASDEAARASWQASRKLPSDPRVTWIGRFIRKASIDELPQLVNVIKGEMSLVGPRPVTEAELDNYGEARQLYAAVKPGLTGMWQVSGRSDLSYARRVALDTWYIENWSPWHDIAILAKTVPVVLGRSGAY
ncbi:exopolysaccharide biosynthesis polyprenyl glycosylphosphotransferase [Rhizobium laguerreae]|uniref:exopolysaccharide biosynthesis polyprenyl glycosylphosphotransferase n=1 Tax=Rhizobium laguerreae TaxID=1076926 RepID=UPI001C901799|nr:exopolysaccharide biosynthesis polyprenyl glycosylphosphotransferase [Rhizobium laguerreae]MBY3150860.1 exopolysaccharide biosynthesis polyprenyl glycosylphosphotransferase [Rhizobium laguerreae]